MLTCNFRYILDGILTNRKEKLVSRKTCLKAVKNKLVGTNIDKNKLIEIYQLFGKANFMRSLLVYNNCFFESIPALWRFQYPETTCHSSNLCSYR